MWRVPEGEFPGEEGLDRPTPLYRFYSSRHKNLWTQGHPLAAKIARRGEGTGGLHQHDSTRQQHDSVRNAARQLRLLSQSDSHTI